MEESKDPVKPWERPWSTEEMRQQSGNWNLAGDAGLLKHLQDFSQNLLSRTHSTEVALDSLMEQLRAVTTDVNNVTNEFLFLANTQFVENRVYDEDEKETPPEEKKEEEKPKSKEEQEAEVVAKVREALALGMTVLDTMFDAVEVPASDSEDEESGGRVVLEPRNPYLNRPLPYIIGSRQFMEDDYGGLKSQSDSEELEGDRNLLQSSESESEMDIEQKDVPKKRIRESSTSASENSDFGASDGSEGGPVFGKQKKMDNTGLFGNPPAASTGNMFGGDSPPDEIGSPVEGAGKRNSFAAELAAKLGGVAAEADVSNPTAPKLKNSGSKAGLSWQDEDNDENGFFGRNDGRFSGGGGLFDDLEDSPGSLWNTKDKTGDKGAKKPLFGGDDNDNSEDNIFREPAAPVDARKHLRVAADAPRVATSTPVSDSGYLESHKQSGIFNVPSGSSLFGGADLDDGNLFDAPKAASKDSTKSTDEVQQPETKTKKKPVGGILVLGNSDLFNAGVRRPPSSFSGSSEESTQPHEKGLFDNSQSISSIAKTSDQKDVAKSKGTSDDMLNKKLSLFDGDDDNLFEPVTSSAQAANVDSQSSKPALSSGLFQDDGAGDSLFSKPHKNLPQMSAKHGPQGSSNAKKGPASQKPLSLFDSDSGDDELIFSSTSSTSSRSRRSQGSGDILASSGDKVKPPTIQTKGLFDNEDELFGGTKEDPGFDIFGTTTVSKPASVSHGTAGKQYDDLFGEEDKNPDFSILKSNQASVPTATFQEKIKNGSKDLLFGDEDDSFDIFGSSNNTKPPKSTVQVTAGNKDNTVKSDKSKISSGGLFSDSEVDDIFATPVSNSQKEQLPPKLTGAGSLFSGGSEVDDLFSEPAQTREDKNAAIIDEFSDQTDDIFSVPKAPSSVETVTESKTILAVSSDSVADTSASTEVFISNNEESSESSSGLLGDASGTSSSIFAENNSTPPVSKKPVISSKPVIKQKPKIPSASKPSLNKHSEDQSNTVKAVEKNSSHNTSPAHNKHTNSEVTEENANPDNNTSTQQNKAATAAEQSTNHSSVASRIEKIHNLTTKESPTTKLEPPKTLNIRKTTDLLFSSSSNEDEDLFGMNFSVKSSIDSNSAEVGEKISSPTSVPLDDDEKPKVFSTEQRSKSEKGISSKLESSQENSSNTVVKARSVGASPRQINIDPTALLPGAKPPPKGQRNAEAAVSFDHPAQSNATLHSAGKERARIQAKRRPPSRRARQEAVRNSGLEFEGFDVATGMNAGLVEEGASKTTSKDTVASEEVHTTPQPPDPVVTARSNISSLLDGNSNLLSPSTDEEDLFGVPQDLPSEYENSKDDNQNLFSSAPVLSPLEFKSEKLPVFSEENKATVISEEHDNVKDAFESSEVEHSVHETPVRTDNNNLSGEQVPYFGDNVYDKIRNEPPLDNFDCDDEEDEDSADLFSVSKKKIPTPRRESEDLFETESVTNLLFTKVKAVPKVNFLDHVQGEIESSSKSDNLVFSQKENTMSQKDPLIFTNEEQSVFPNIPYAEPHGELFKSGSEKQTDYLFSSKKISDEKVHVPAKVGSNPLSYSEDDDDLFSSGTKSSVFKDNKSRTSVDKSNIFSSKENSLVENLFSSGKQSQSVPPEDDLFSSSAQDVKPQKSAVTEKKVSSDLFGDDSPEGDDLFISSQKKISAPVTKAKSSGISAASVKSSLFDEDEDDDIFGGSVKSGTSAKPTSVPIDHADNLFASGSTTKNPKLKINKPSALNSSRRVATEENDLFEDPLMVITKK